VNEDLAAVMASRGIPTADAVWLDGLEQPAEAALDVTDELDLRPVGRVDLRRLRVDVDDPLVPVRVPAGGRVLDQVIPD
jgi:hypothetical protein